MAVRVAARCAPWLPSKHTHYRRAPVLLMIDCPSQGLSRHLLLQSLVRPWGCCVVCDLMGKEQELFSLSCPGVAAGRCPTAVGCAWLGGCGWCYGPWSCASQPPAHLWQGPSCADLGVLPCRRCTPCFGARLVRAHPRGCFPRLDPMLQCDYGDYSVWSSAGSAAGADGSVLFRAGAVSACSPRCLQHGLCFHPSTEEHAQNAVAGPVSNSCEN